MQTKSLVASVVFLLVACETATISPRPDIAAKVAGDWLVISEKQKQNNYEINEDPQGVIAHWGGTNVDWTVQTISFNKDKTIELNHFDVKDLPVSGTWKINDNKTVILNTEIEYVGIVLRDTFQFEVSFDGSGYLIMENEHLLTKHKRLH